MDKNVTWMTLTCSLLSRNSLNLMAPFCTSTFTSQLLEVYLNVHTRERERERSLVYIMHAYSYTHVSAYMGLGWWMVGSMKQTTI